MNSMARTNSKKKKPSVSENSEQQDLCFSCINLNLCTFIQGSRQPVIFCEEFADDDRTSMGVTQGTQRAVAHEEVYFENHRGLCTTCENHNDCIFSKQEGGVWHCEEYR